MSRETHIVGFRVGRETYGVPITSLHEIVRVPEITAVPDAPDYLEGVINLRGKIVSVVDLRKRFGQPSAGLDRRSRILVVEHRGRLAGMIVDSASEVLKIPESEIEAAPAMMREGGLDCVTGLGKYKGRLIILLDISKVLGAREMGNEESAVKPAEKPAASGSGKAGTATGTKSASAGKHQEDRTLMNTSDTPALTDAELKLLQALVYQECGMHFDDRRTSFLQDRLQRRLKECQLDSFYSYYRLLISQQGKQELSRLLENLTVNETSFFRNKAQLDLFQREVMDDILRRKQARREYSVRIWSAGCSTGQEPYTIAMLVADALSYYYLRNPLPVESPVPKPMVPAPWRVEILASDINYSVLRTAQEGSYGEHQMLGVDYGYRLRYFDKMGARYAVKKNVKELVHFDFHNLKTEYLPQRNDIIFCRNVMMYFDEAEQKRLVEKFYRCLNPQGYLFVGHAESLLGLTEKFQMVHHNSGTAYQRVEVKM